MAIQNEPSRITIPFAASGTKNSIPDTQPSPSASQAASWTDGFPAQCSLPLSAGGIPPARGDFNGIFNAITQSERFTQEGGVWSWSSAVDYAPNRIVLGSDGKIYWSAAQSGPNTSAGAKNPVTDDGTYWGRVPANVDYATNAGYAVSATSATNAASATNADYAQNAGYALFSTSATKAKGIDSWSNAEDYAIGQLVLGSDGRLYMAQAASGPDTGAGAKDPAADGGTYWSAPSVASLPLSSQAAGAVSAKWVKDLAAVSVYLDPAGSDLNDGLSPSTPVSTFTKALSVMSSLPQDAVKLVVAGGSYNTGAIFTDINCVVELQGNVAISGQVLIQRSRVSILGSTYTMAMAPADGNAALRIEKCGVFYAYCNISVTCSNASECIDILNSSSIYLEGTLSITANGGVTTCLLVSSGSTAYFNGAVTIGGTGATNGVSIMYTSHATFNNGLNESRIFATPGSGLMVYRSSSALFYGGAVNIYGTQDGPACFIDAVSFVGFYSSSNIQFLHSGAYQLLCANCSYVQISIPSDKTMNFSTDNCIALITAFTCSAIDLGAGQFNFQGTVSQAGIFCHMNSCIIREQSATPLTGTVIGKKYVVTNCGMINSNGLGPNGFIGTVAGDVGSSGFALYL